MTDGGITWTCSVCETENPIDTTICPVCGADLGRTLKGPERERPQRDAGQTALVSLFVPGGGHGYLGLWGEAVGRFVMWAFVTVVFFVSAIEGSALLAAVFGLLTVGLWVVHAHDAYREASGERGAVLLRGQTFMYLVLGIVGVLFVLLVVGFFRARGEL